MQNIEKDSGKLIRFSKPVGAMFEHKKNYFEDNNSLLEKERELIELYISQPKRVSCKNCTEKLNKPHFIKMGIPYIICARCGHLNGGNEDTDSFCNTLYRGDDDDGSSYAANYKTGHKEKYIARLRDIYMPKVEFLRDALQVGGVDPEMLTYADLGAGGGYFVAGLLDAGLSSSCGYEVSKDMVRLAGVMRPDVDLTLTNMADIYLLARSVKADVVSLIGVLEHLQNPREVLASLRDNPHVKYVYILVPLFSPSVFIEMSFPAVAQRLLGVWHTHLYTEKSIDYLCEEYGMSRIGEWWFGADIMDLYRSLMVTITQNSINDSFEEVFADMMFPLIDKLQGQLDRSKMCSEVHMLLNFNGK